MRIRTIIGTAKTCCHHDEERRIRDSRAHLTGGLDIRPLRDLTDAAVTVRLTGAKDVLNLESAKHRDVVPPVRSSAWHQPIVLA